MSYGLIDQLSCILAEPQYLKLPHIVTLCREPPFKVSLRSNGFEAKPRKILGGRD
jgi:hypothetical protein